MSDESAITVITERGQTSVPAAIRRELSLTKGRRLLWDRVGPRELRIVVLEDRPAGSAEASRGFARRFRPKPRRTADWMKELRAGER